MMGHVHQIPREHLRHTIRMSAERAKEADRLACEAWNYRMLGYKGPAQGDALNAGYLYLKCGVSVATRARPLRLV